MEDPDQGMFGLSSRAERDACGVGFVASRRGAASHGLLQEALGALACMEHRGACGADQLTGDGAGVMTDIPWDLLGYRKGEVAVASLFMPQDYARRVRSLQVFTATMEYHGLEIAAFREVPVDRSVLGEEAAGSCPAMVHVILKRPAYCRTDLSFDRLLYTIKQEIRSRQSDQGIKGEFFFTSLSGSTMVYKALTRSDALDRFYLDLRDPRYATRFALFHRRFSTNTRTSWDKAQPFRRIAHNGEINTIAGNRSWAHSRERHIGLRRDQLLTRSGISDSGSLNEMVEALLYRSAIPHIEDILAIMMPPAQNQGEFYKFWSRAMEPWDGPAIILFSDGNTVGARLDRHGFRPSRWALTEDAFYLSSEAGAFRIDEERIQRKGTLHAGTGVKVDLDSGRVHFRDPSLSRENRDARFDARTIPMETRPAEAGAEAPVDLATRVLFSFTDEEQEKLLYPMAAAGREPIGSMGDTARPNVFSVEARPFFDYFYQNFAQVTNPPLDYLREENVTDLRVFLGRKPNIFFPKDLLPLEPAVEAASPVLTLGEMRYLQSLAQRTPSTSHIIPRTFPMTFPRAAGAGGLRPAVERLVADVLKAVEQRCTVIILSDRDADFAHPPIPGLIALRAVVSALNHSGLRLNASVVLETGEARTPHHVAALLAFGASAVCPYLALRIARGDEHRLLQGLDPDQRERNLVKALVSGLLKIMSKSGISVLQSYISAKLFTAIGLGDELMENFFPGDASPIGGIGYLELAADILEKTALVAAPAFQERLGSTWQFRENPRGGGERHAMTSARARLVHQAVADGQDPAAAAAAWAGYLAAGEAAAPVSVRHLFDLKPAGAPLPLDQVEPAAAILARFGAGAMSFGAVSAESQRDLILAMREVGGRSNSGEGGENPYYYTDGISASTKQVASARFGVTAEYLLAGRELQIKVAQGAKPGEGGQLMAVKVDAAIARARFSMPGVDLISPPPLHDIYSIEDLKELIYELRQVHPEAAISVKLVSGTSLGAITVGVVKAGADIIYIAGGDGGTGAATLGSMKHAGLPVEFGLAEAHRALVENGLRGSVELRADGGLLTGRDIVVAALLGAEGFDFGKLLLVAEGCIMARICEKNTCPAGIASHDPKYKARYTGSKDKVVRLLRLLAEDVRGQLAEVGCRSLGELTGRTDLLATAAGHADWLQARKLRLDRFLVPPRAYPGHPTGAAREPVSDLNRRIVEEVRAGAQDFSCAISTQDRAVLATLSGLLASGALARPAAPLRFTFQGSAGQGFGVFLVAGLEATLFGEANDSLAKGMSGGRIVVRPWARASFAPEDNAIIGNCALYGATGGTLLVHGLAGDRFAVRNSGATAVVEGAGLHACEYMTRGTVLFLGPVSHNVGAGMTGGKIFLDRQHDLRVNRSYIRAHDLDAADGLELRALLEDYAGVTGSRTAGALLQDWERTLVRFAKYVPL